MHYNPNHMASHQWNAKGLLFENCSCQLLCPAHVSFKHTCDGDRCHGHWCFHIDSGQFNDVSLNNTNIAVVFDAPTTMYEGDWTQVFYVDEATSPAQRHALESIFSGHTGGPWSVLSRFVSEQLETRVVPMTFEDNDRQKTLVIPGIFETAISAVPGADGDGDAIISNLHNVIHGPVHTMARGKSRHTDSTLGFSVENTHALYSYFSWNVTQ
ncbi:MAG TPA: DUF1326 domain-containing protein [Acidobacteria bacterium]|nr:DUF1326 domain-containing protein [Acidobacteriota bacterium]